MIFFPQKLFFAKSIIKKIKPALAYKNLRNAKRSDPRDCDLIWDETYKYTLYNKKISVGTLWWCN